MYKMSKRTNSTSRMSLSINKRPRLDVKITNSQSNNTRNVPQVTPKINGFTKNDAPQEDMWGDDLDAEAVEECLILASQVSEQVLSIDVHNVSELPSFSEFRPPQTTSTQVNRPLLTQAQKPYPAMPSTSKNDVTNISGNKNMVPINSFTVKPNNIQENNKNKFLVPKPVTNGLNFQSHKNNVYIAETNAPIYVKPPQQNLNFSTRNITNFNIANGHVHAILPQWDSVVIQQTEGNMNECQVLSQKLLDITLECERLKMECEKATDKCMTKEGEVSMLRSKLQASKTTADFNKVERLKFEDKIKTEYAEKLATGSKHIQDLKSQLEFKDMELTRINERCRLLESNKIRLTEPQSSKMNDTLFNGINFSNHSTRNNGFRKVDGKNIRTNEVSIQTQFNLANYVNQLKDNHVIFMPLLKKLPRELCERNELTLTKKYDKNENGHVNCISVNSILDELSQFVKFTDIQLSSPVVNEMLRKIICISHEILLRQTTIKNGSSYVVTKNDLSVTLPQLKLCHSTYAVNEKYYEKRKILTILSLLSPFCPYLVNHIICDTNISQKILHKNNHWLKMHKDCFINLRHNESNTYLCFERLIKDIDYITQNNGIKSEVLFLVSILKFIKNMICSNYFHSYNHYVKGIIKKIIFLPPPPRVTYAVVSVLENLSRCYRNTTFLDFLCCDSTGDSWSLEFNQGLQRYTDDSCILQVLSTVLETSVPRSTTKTNEWHFLHKLTYKLISLLNNSIINKIEWTYTRSTKCDCFREIFSCFIILLFLCVEQYNNQLFTEACYFTSLALNLKMGLLLLRYLFSKDCNILNLLTPCDSYCYVILQCVNKLKDKLQFEENYNSIVNNLMADMVIHKNSMNKIIENPELNLKWEESFSQYYNSD